MDKAKKLYSLLIVLFLSNSLLAKDISPELDQDWKLNVSGINYNIQLKENRDLLKRIDVANDSLTSQSFAKHYSGELEGQENSWYRVSRINDHWTGIVSLNNNSYVIDDYIDQDFNNDASDTNSLQKVLSAISVAESTDGEPLHCGVDSHNHAADNSHASSAKSIYTQITNKQADVDNSSMSSSKTHSAVGLNQKPANLCADFSDGVCLIAEIEFVFDTLFQDAFSTPAEAQQEALALINMVEGFYLNDFEVKFDALTIEFLTSDVFSTTLNAGDLLTDIREKKRNDSLSFVKNPGALLHLVTGRDFDGSTVGTAFLGVLCNSSGGSSGHSQLLRRNGSPTIARTALITAHEIGHNFGASHDGSGNSCSGAFIMAPSVNGDSTGFSTCSIESISAEINSLTNYSLCFNFPTDLSISADSSNPTTVAVGESIVTDYSIAIDDSSFEQVSSINVNGSLPNGSGAFQSVSVNGTTCSITNAGQSYNCSLSTITIPINLTATSLVSNSNFEQTHTVSVGGSAEIIDVNQSNDSVVSAFNNSAVTPPSSVTNAMASIDTSGSTDVVTITWQDNSSTEDGFVIERSLNSGSFSELTQLGVNATSFTDSAVNPGNTYSYRILAFNAGGPAAASNTSSVTLVGTAPSGVTGVTASENTAGTSIDVAWQDNSNNEDEFIIQRSVNAGTFSNLASVAANVTSYSDSNISASTSYAYRVVASNSFGAGTTSNEASVTTSAAPTAPPNSVSNVVASIDASGSADVVTITWQDNSSTEDGFVIDRSVNSGSFTRLTQLGVNSTSFTDSGVSPGTTYSYIVLAFNSGGVAAASNTSTVTLGIAPNAVSNVTASINAAGTGVDVAWQDNSNNEDEFIIQRSVNSGTFTQLASVAANVSSFSDSDINASTTYAYRVVASNSTGAASASNEASVTTAAAPIPPTPTPTPPADNSGDGGGGSLNIFLLSLFLWMIAVKRNRFNTVNTLLQLKREDNA